MKAFLKKKRFIIGGLTLLTLIGVIALVASGGQKEEYITDTVRRGELKQTVEITGETSPLLGVDLSFASSGIIADIFVRTGESVTAGSVLAELQAADLAADVARARADLALKLAGSTSEDVEIAQADVASALASLEAAKIEVQNAESKVSSVSTVTLAQMKEAELAVSTAVQNVQDAKDNSISDEADTKENLINGLSVASASVRAALSKVDEILGLENTYFNDAFEDELGAGNSELLEKAKAAFEQAADERDRAEAAVYALPTDPTDTELQSTENRVNLALEATVTTLLYTRQVLDVTFADSVDLSLADLVAFKTSMDTARSSIQAEQKNVTTLSQVYHDSLTSGSQAVIAAETALKSAEESLKRVRAGAEGDDVTALANLASAQAAVTSRTADLDRARASERKASAGPRAIDLAPLQAAVNGAQARYRNAQIISPVAGRVTSITVNEGEAVNFGTVAITVEAFGENFAILIDIPESDVTKVTNGDPALITLDALGEDIVFRGTLTDIEHAPKIIEGVVFYEASVILESGQDLSHFRDGMSADVAITTESKKDALYVPQRAVLEQQNKRYIRVLVNGSLEERPVVTGLRGDDGLLEILSGVEEGETVVVSVKK